MVIKSKSYNLDIEAINGLARSYNALDYPQKLRSILYSILPNIDFNAVSKHSLHQIINNILLKNHSGEDVLKYLLMKEFLSKNVTGAFELKVNNSRIDFVTINGDTRSYEIKSNLDNLDKLSKQISDYLNVFEYNFVVIDEKHLKNTLKILPESYGIWIYKNNKKEIVRNAILNEKLNASLQLNIFTKKELELFFKDFGSDKNMIVNNFTSQSINFIFKQMLKKRYANKWEFIKTNKNSILPIDYSFFYHNNISPDLVYGIN